MQESRDVEWELAKSLKKLVIEKPFEKITIKQIADGAGVIRVTFYNHFQDKYDLLAWIVERDIFKPVKILLSNLMYRQAMILIFTNMRKEKEFYTRVEKLTGQNSFSEIVTRCAEELILDLLHERGVTGSRESFPYMTPEYMARYYANSMCYVLMDWIRSGMETSPEDMSIIYAYLGSHSIQDLLK